MHGKRVAHVEVELARMMKDIAGRLQADGQCAGAHCCTWTTAQHSAAVDRTIAPCPPLVSYPAPLHSLFSSQDSWTSPLARKRPLLKSGFRNKLQHSNAAFLPIQLPKLFPLISSAFPYLSSIFNSPHEYCQSHTIPIPVYRIVGVAFIRVKVSSYFQPPKPVPEPPNQPDTRLRKLLVTSKRSVLFPRGAILTQTPRQDQPRGCSLRCSWRVPGI